MTAAERIRLCRILETMKRHEQMSESLGLKDTSKFININKTKPQKKGGGKNEIYCC